MANEKGKRNRSVKVTMQGLDYCAPPPPMHSFIRFRGICCISLQGRRDLYPEAEAAASPETLVNIY
jgi:hypothetical protein